jgi:hypothetical protein
MSNQFEHIPIESISSESITSDAGPPESTLLDTTPAPTSAPHRRGIRSIALAVTGVLVLGAVGLVAVRTLSGADAGASSPIDAVDRLLTSIADEDPISAINVLSPSDLEPFANSIADVTDLWQRQGDAYDRLTEAGVDFDPDDPIPGFELSIDDRGYGSDDQPDVARVTITSLNVNWSFDVEAFLAAVDIEQLSNGLITNDDVRNEVANAEEVAGGDTSNGDGTVASGTIPLDDLRVFDGDDTFVMTVQRDGRWYVSPLYTALEYLRIGLDLPAPTFAAPAGAGAGSAEEALANMITAVVAGDSDGILDLLPPGSYQPFFDYRDALRELAGGGSGYTTDVQLDPLQRQDGTDEYVLQGGTITVTGEYDTTEITIDGTCFSATTTFSDGEVSDGGEVCLSDLADELTAQGLEAPDLPDALSAVIVERDGRFYVDPLATLTGLQAALGRGVLI